MVRFASGDTSNRFDPKIPGEVAERIVENTEKVTLSTMATLNEMNDTVEMIRSEYNQLSNDMAEMRLKLNNQEGHFYAIDANIIKLKIIARVLDKILRSPIVRFFNFFGKWYHYDKKKDEIYWESSDIIDGIFNLTQYVKEPF